MITSRGFENEEFVESLPVVTEGQNLIKASLFNLIVVANTLHRAYHCQELTKIVTEKYPCRVIFVQADEASPSDFFRESRTMQAIGTGSTRVCFDQITVESSPSQLNKVPFVVLPNLLPELPIYLLVGYDPTQDRMILPALQKYVSRVIFDMDEIEGIQRFSEGILAIMHQAQCDFIDINWARTKAWREIIARVFNDQQKIATLSNSKMIQISYCQPSQQHAHKAELQALYLQAWLAAQLNWKLTAVERESGFLRISYHSGTVPITLSCVPRDTSAQEVGAIFSMEVMSHDDRHFLLSCDGLMPHVVVHSSTPETCEIPYSIFLHNFQKGTPLVQEIFYQPPSEHYLNMLHILNHHAWK